MLFFLECISTILSVNVLISMLLWMLCGIRPEQSAYLSHQMRLCMFLNLGYYCLAYN